MKNKLILLFGLIISTLLFGCSSGEFVNSAAPIDPLTIQYDTIGIYVVVDASGSMSSKVRNANNQREEKFEIANRALITLGQKLDKYLEDNPSNKIASGIVLLRGGRCTLSANGVFSNGVERFYTEWVKKYPGTSGGTPLGRAIDVAALDLQPLRIKSKHIIVLTDGGSNEGPSPDSVIQSLQKSFVDSGTPLETHFIAFDVSSGLFADVRNLGSTVVEAFDEKELNEKFQFILMEKVLLEKED